MHDEHVSNFSFWLDGGGVSWVCEDFNLLLSSISAHMASLIISCFMVACVLLYSCLYISLLVISFVSMMSCLWFVYVAMVDWMSAIWVAASLAICFLRVCFLVVLVWECSGSVADTTCLKASQSDCSAVVSFFHARIALSAWRMVCLHGHHSERGDFCFIAGVFGGMQSRRARVWLCIVFRYLMFCSFGHALHFPDITCSASAVP